MSHNRDNKEVRNHAHLNNMKRHYPDREPKFKTDYLASIPYHEHNTCDDGFAGVQIYRDINHFVMPNGTRLPFVVWTEFIKGNIKPLDIEFYFRPLPDDGMVCIMDRQGN